MEILRKNNILTSSLIVLAGLLMAFAIPFIVFAGGGDAGDGGGGGDVSSGSISGLGDAAFGGCGNGASDGGGTDANGYSPCVGCFGGDVFCPAGWTPVADGNCLPPTSYSQGSYGGGGGGSGSGNSQDSSNTGGNTSPPPPPPPPAPGATITCTPPELLAGGSLTVTWSCSNATSSSGNGFSTGGALSGSTSVSADPEATYTVVCSNDTQSVQAQCDVDILNPQLNIDANPDRVRKGNTSSINWQALNVKSCTVDGPDFSATGVSGAKQTGPIEVESTYRLICQTDLGAVIDSVTVKLIPTFEEF
ncbi:hypothetical protein COU17_02435 [Candidatus Kaiserbacteria bacterium CG10_big_fil_rev_8_21_14_0_10_49_17]|uniref:Uncharacterized protein n=1 Tax=Candidatus Kaiserbacteria bacterium CG10_big_fil_rev_8_21_14_0_10_49_17 TaxID=1974609 RepID=A0A2M6WE94_9BACT|nr:MAG: hypothetical protein COU17_02435 [Candidatus Kaiserbacteria bacterium CG10_big_fil_rev_8_21_14_0_10_49_17]